MGHRELVASLRREGEEKVSAIRQAAEAEVERFRGEATAGMLAVRDAFSKRQTEAMAVESEKVLGEAQRRAALIKLEAENRLAGRLRGMAIDSLAGLRDDRYAERFTLLAAELPPCKWETIRVNPSDSELARSRFPDTHIEPDCGISGGMKAATAGGRMTVDNTFEKRLERSWPELMPPLIQAVSRMV
jgi:V/A-type H+/Na+-transporting ATPase subunit E